MNRSLRKGIGVRWESMALLSCLRAGLFFSCSAAIAALVQAAHVQAQDYFVNVDRHGRVLMLREPFARAAGPVRPASEVEKELSARKFVASKLRELKINGALELQRVDTDAKIGDSHARFIHTVAAVPVYGSSLTTHVGFDGAVKLATASLQIPPSDLALVPRISQSEAVERARGFWVQRAIPGIPRSVATQLMIVNEDLISSSRQQKFHLAWRVELLAERSHERLEIFVGAVDGRVLGHVQLHSDARLVYDCSRMDIDDGVCYAGRPIEGGGYLGRKDGSPAAGPNPIYGTTDTDQVWDSITAINDYYLARFGRNGANGQGGISDGSQYPIADTRSFTFMDKDPNFGCPNASFNGLYAQFCTDFGMQRDVVGHELAHALTFATAKLIYRSESGALNESFSDIFGNAVEVFTSGNQNEWGIGEGLREGALRDMADPTRFTYINAPYPDRFHSPNFYCGTSDNQGVHGNSSVLNKGAYLIAVGGDFNGCSIQGIGREKMEQVAYRALTVYLQQSSTFNQAFNAFVQSAIDLYGAQAAEVTSVTKALMAVEMNQPGLCSGQPANQPRCDSVGNPAPPVPPTDQCPSDPAKTDPGLCGCGIPDVDANGNGVIDCQEVADRDVELLALESSRRVLPSKGGLVEFRAIVRNLDLVSQANIAVIEKRSGFRQAFPMALMDAQGNQALLGTQLRFTRGRSSGRSAIRFQTLFEVYLKDGRYGWAEIGDVIIRKKKARIWLSARGRHS